MNKVRDLFESLNGADNKKIAKFIEMYPLIWEDCFDIEYGSRYHMAILSAFDAAYKLQADEIEKLKKEIGFLKPMNEQIKKDIEKIKFYSDQGWSITMSCAKAGLPMIPKNQYLYQSEQYKQFSKENRKTKRGFK